MPCAPRPIPECYPARQRWGYARVEHRSAGGTGGRGPGGGDLSAQSVAQGPVPNAAAPTVRAVYEAALRALPFTDQQDFADARRGFIATLPAGQDTRRYGFLADEKVPDSVHPSLWRLARLNAINGLFEVVPGVYQVRGLALANVTFIEAATGLIIVDPLGSVGAARASSTCTSRIARSGPSSQ